MYEKDRFEQIQMKYFQSDESSWNLMMGGSFTDNRKFTDNYV